MKILLKIFLSTVPFLIIQNSFANTENSTHSSHGSTKSSEKKVTMKNFLLLLQAFHL